MTDLVEFLLARITEDEQQERGKIGGPSIYGTPWNWRSTARVLAECEAKRRIVERLTRAADLTWSGSYAVRDDARSSLMDLALPYADHSDYREEWQP